jgi:PAS domain S-box-containing protein
MTPEVRPANSKARSRVLALVQLRESRIARLRLAYILAVILPIVSWIVTDQIPWLHHVPMALQFLSMALVATLGGLGPAAIVVVLSIATRFVEVYYDHFSAGAFSESTRVVALILGALIITLLSRRRHRSEEQLEIALMELQERTDALVESLSSSRCAAWVLDLDSKESARWQKGSYPVFGRPYSELEQLPSLEPFLHPEDRACVRDMLQQARDSKQPFFSEHRCVWPDDSVHWLEMRGTHIPGTRNRWRGVTLDITERKLSEAALLSSEKLAAMGRLASTVAHEINNPLEAVTNLLYLARGDETLDTITRSYLTMAERELARLGNITRLTLGFVRTANEVVDVEVASGVEDVLSILQHRFDASEVRIQRNYEPSVQVSIPPHELRQIATNLIANASDAVTAAAAQPTVAIFIERDGEKAVLRVEDNGDGIPPDNLSRIFDPFFSTKKEVGTGIGLWVTKEIVEKNGGRITAESGDLDSGFRTSFRVEFPLATPSMPATKSLSA